MFIIIEDEKDFRNTRNTQKLTLRKKAVNQRIMEHRKILEENRTLNFINIRNLNIGNNKEIIRKLSSLKTGEEKILFMTTYLENNIEIIDIFSDLFYYQTNSNNISDLDKYFLLNILAILDKNVMRKCFPDKIIKENNFIFCKDNPLRMTQKLFILFFSILFNVKIKEVQVTIIMLLLSYSENSNDFVNYCLEDIRYINKLFELTYINDIDIMTQVGFILNNIIIYTECNEEKLKEILKTTPLIQRCKELISINNFNDSLKLAYLELLESIVETISKEEYGSLFSDFIYIFSNILSSTPNNEKVFNVILRICIKLSYDEKICNEIMKTGLGYNFYNALLIPNLQNEFTIKLLKIFSNLFYLDSIIIYFINNYDGKIIPTFIRIINTYLHTANERDLILLKELVFCLSNFVSGPPETQTIISKSDIPNLVFQIMKIKSDNNLYFEGINFFYNILESCNKETFTIISELHPFKLFANGLEKSGINENIILCLNGIINLIEKNNEIYHTIENLKTDFYICGAKREMDKLINHTNEDIAEKSLTILNFFDDKMKTD